MKTPVPVLLDTLAAEAALKPANQNITGCATARQAWKASSVFELHDNLNWYLCCSAYFSC